MHYIRLLRPPTLVKKPSREVTLSLVLTITTDLGDSFLAAEDPVPLSVLLQTSSADGSGRMVVTLVDGSSPRQRQQCLWRAGLRVLKTDVLLPPQLASEMLASTESGKTHVLCIRAADPSVSASNTDIIIRGERALVMPIFFPFPSPLNHGDQHVATRRLQLISGDNQALTIEVEEDIGESIARHVWDAGLVAVSLVADILRRESSRGHGPLKEILSCVPSLNILELGTGVGIFGLGAAGTLETSRVSSVEEVNVLLTDLPDGEERATANIRRYEQTHSQDAEQSLRLRVGYENLDWEDGKQGVFGEQLRARPWQLIVISDCTYNVDMLPALVKTLSAIHALQSGEGPTRVLLATKPRHPSEKALFDLMAYDEWTIKESSTLPLPILGSVLQTVEVYLFGKDVRK